METPSAIVIRVPESFGGKEARKLRRELKKRVSTNRPCVIVDMSRVKKIDLSGLEGLLKCMEEISKQDGTLELGAISAEAATLLELTRLDKLFQKFPAVQLQAPVPEFVPDRAGATEQVSASGSVQPQPVAA